MLGQYLKKGAYNSFFYALSSASVRCINFLLLPYQLAYFSLEEFGKWDLYQLYFSYGTLFLSSCTATGMTRFYLNYQSDRKKQSQSIGNSFGISLLVAFISLIPGLLLFQINDFRFLTLINVIFFAFFSLVLSYVRMKEQVGWYFLFYFSQSTLATFFTIIGITYDCGLATLWYANLCSTVIFVPAFLFIFYQNRSFSFDLLKSQFTYSFPLFLYSFVYVFFISIDRWFINYYFDYQMLGIYSLLWRFGLIFQFISVALMDAWPIVIFNAQNERNSNELIGDLVRYFCIVLLTAGFITLGLSHIGITYFLQEKYHFLCIYLPLFFLPIMLLEITRIFQVGFALSNKTFFVPIMGVGIIGIQMFFLYTFKPLGLWGIFCANSATFLLYSIGSFFISKKIYTINLELKKTVYIFGCLGIIIGAMQCAIWLNSISFLTALFAFWPLLLIKTSIITSQEKNKFINKLITVASNLLVKYYRPIFSEPQSINQILYLRTDICSQEIKAGGSIAHTLGVLNGFKARQIKLIVGSSAIKTTLTKESYDQFVPLNIPCAFIFLRWKLNYLRWRLECLFSTLWFARQLQKNIKTDVDLIYQRYSLLNATGLLLSLKLKKSLILEYNGSEVWLFDQSAPKNWFKFNCVAKFIEKINLLYASKIIVVSQPLKDNLVEQGVPAGKILVNPNGVDTELYNPELLIDKRTEFRKKLDLTNKFVFGFVGTFSFWHGIEIITKMIPIVVNKVPTAHFLLIGSGPLISLIESLIQKHPFLEKNITLTGLVSADNARYFLSACDAFLCPNQPFTDGTRFFGSPTKLFEYLSMGKPIIASDIEQLSEIINPAVRVADIEQNQSIQNEIGVLVDPKDYLEFARAALYLCQSSKTTLMQFAKNTRKKTETDHTWKSHTIKIINFLQK